MIPYATDRALRALRDAMHRERLGADFRVVSLRRDPVAAALVVIRVLHGGRCPSILGLRALAASGAGDPLPSAALAGLGAWPEALPPLGAEVIEAVGAAADAVRAAALDALVLSEREADAGDSATAAAALAAAAPLLLDLAKCRANAPAVHQARALLDTLINFAPEAVGTVPAAGCEGF